MSNQQNTLDLGSIHDSHVTKLGKRGFMKKLAAAGFSAASIAGLSVGDIKASASDEVPIVIGQYRKDPSDPSSKIESHVKQVPKVWYEGLQKARKEKQEIQNSLLNRENVVGVAINPGEKAKQSKITVAVNPDKEAEIKPTLPAESNGVPIETKSMTPGKRGSSCDTSTLDNWDASTDTGYGGYLIYNYSGDKYGTLGCPVYQDGKTYGLSNHHVLTHDGTLNDAITDDTSDHHFVGATSEKHCREDWAVFESDIDIFSQVRFSDYNYISGNFTKDGSADLASQKATCTKVGQTTCKTSFTITNSNGMTEDGESKCKRNYHHNFYEGTDSDFDPGDSGSLVYHESPNDPDLSWAVGLASYYHPYFSDSDISGVAAFRIVDRGYNF